jgi:hypothetical protein
VAIGGIKNNGTRSEIGIPLFLIPLFSLVGALRTKKLLSWNDRKITDGLLDRKKQSRFYADVTKTGEIGLHPGLITREEASEAIKRAECVSEGPITILTNIENLRRFSSLFFRA